MSTEHKPHSALDRAKEFLGEIEQRPLDYAEGLVYDLVEQLEALHRAALRVNTEHGHWVSGRKRSGDDFWLALEDGLFPLLDSNPASRSSE